MSDEREPTPSAWEDALASGRVSFVPDRTVLRSAQAERTVLLDYAHGRYYGLNRIAAFVWQQLLDDRDFSAIVAAITTEYDVDEATARADVARLLGDLRDRQIIRVIGDA